MASTNFTTHYSIPLPLGTDLTTPMDYNEAAEEIDTALFGAVTDAGNASEAAGEAVNTANTASAAVDAIGADLALEKAKIVQLQTRMTAAENNIDDVYTDVTDMITAYKEPSATSTHAYAIGDYFIYNETLYKATAEITVGATIVPNTNCETTNVSSELKQINSDLSDVENEFTDYVKAQYHEGQAINYNSDGTFQVSASWLSGAKACVIDTSGSDAAHAMVVHSIGAGSLFGVRLSTTTSGSEICRLLVFY